VPKFRCIGIIAMVVVVAAGAFFFAGFYNVGASAGDIGVVNWAKGTYAHTNNQ
jgi:hypothetical protein